MRVIAVSPTCRAVPPSLAADGRCRSYRSYRPAGAVEAARGMRAVGGTGAGGVVGAKGTAGGTARHMASQQV